MSKFETFAALHVPGNPLILFNVWDAGSAKVAARAGAKAIATGSASVATAHGVSDAEALPLALALANAERIVAAVEVPVTIDFEGGYAVDAEALAGNMAALAATGAVGCNFEDQVIGGQGIHPIEVQAQRIAARGAGRGPTSSSTHGPTSSCRPSPTRMIRPRRMPRSNARMPMPRPARAASSYRGWRTSSCSQRSAPPRRCR
jgi:hypothetical protein